MGCTVEPILIRLGRQTPPSAANSCTAKIAVAIPAEPDFMRGGTWSIGDSGQKWHVGKPKAAFSALAGARWTKCDQKSPYIKRKYQF